MSSRSTRVGLLVAVALLARPLWAVPGNDTAAVFPPAQVACYEWVQVSADGIDARSSVAATDAWRNVVVAFGGIDDAGVALTELREWDGFAWSANLQPAIDFPRPGQASGAATFDSRRGRFVYAGTWAGGELVGNTGTWNGSSWAPILPSTLEREGHALAYDTQSGDLIVNGGRLGVTVVGDTRRLTSAGWELIAGGKPVADHAMAFDAAVGKLYRFGGVGRNGRPTSKLEWLGDEGWEAVPPNGPAPGPRAGHVMVYDPNLPGIVLHGGRDADGNPLADTWLLMGGVWKEITPAGLALALDEHIAAFDPVHNRIIVTGGSSSIGTYALQERKSVLITLDPSSVVATGGDRVEFAVDFVGDGPPTVQWLADGVPLSDGGRISGANGPVLTIDDVQPGDSGLYAAIVTNICNEAYSQPATLAVIIDCNGNQIPDDVEILEGLAADCNTNGVPDECDILPPDPDDPNSIPFSQDVNANGIPDECEDDCNGNGLPDEYEIAIGLAEDCNVNRVPDECDLTSDEPSADINDNGIPDECEPDCNANGLPDSYEISIGLAEDCNRNERPDACDVDQNGAVEDPSPDVNQNGIPDECEADCNRNGIPDEFEIATGAAEDCNANGVPDTCDVELDDDGPTSLDVNENGVPDECETDCNGNAIPDAFEVATGAAPDCNANGVPDACDIDSQSGEVVPFSTDINANGIPDECEADCNANGVPDLFEIATGLAEDCDANGLPDDCQVDSDSNGVIDACEPVVDPNDAGRPDPNVPDPNDAGRPDPNAAEDFNKILSVLRALNALIAGLDPEADAVDVATLREYVSLLTTSPDGGRLLPAERVDLDEVVRTVADVYQRRGDSLDPAAAATVADVVGQQAADAAASAQPVAVGLCPMMALLLLSGLLAGRQLSARMSSRRPQNRAARAD